MTKFAQQKLDRLKNGEKLGPYLAFVKANIDNEGFLEILAAIRAIPGYAATIIYLDMPFNYVNLAEFHLEDFSSLKILNLRFNNLPNEVKIFKAPNCRVNLYAYFVNVTLVTVKPELQDSGAPSVDTAWSQVLARRFASIIDQLEYIFVAEEPPEAEFVIVNAPEKEPTPALQLKNI